MSTKYEITGTIKEISEIQTFASGFTKRQFVVTDDTPKFPQDIPLEFVKDGCVKLDSFRVGDRVTVAFNLRGNEHNGRHYLSLAAWKIDRVGAAQDAHNESKANGYQPQRQTSQSTAPPPSRTATADALDDFDEGDDIDSIPF